GTGAAWQLLSDDDARCSSFFVRLPSTPGTPIQMLRKRAAGNTLLATVRVNGSRELFITASTASAVDTANFALSTNTWYQCIWDVPGDGTQTLKIYTADGATLLDTLSGSAAAGTVTETFIGQN